MSDSNATLLPCPICGRKATIDSWWSNDEECGKAWVGCSRESYTNGYECARICIMRCNEKVAKEDAIHIWNTRTPEQAVAATLGADDGSRWFELFGTPERAAETLAKQCFGSDYEACSYCVNADCDERLRKLGSFESVRRELLEWLRGKAGKND